MAMVSSIDDPGRYRHHRSASRIVEDRQNLLEISPPQSDWKVLPHAREIEIWRSSGEFVHGEEADGAFERVLSE
jgi:hypothetical protein